MKLFIHGKWYELDSSWEHPGGPVALRVAEGRDATALFELHHPFVSREKLGALLSRFEVPAKRALQFVFDDPREKESDFDWETKATPSSKSGLVGNDPFRQDLVDSLQAYFEEESKRRGVPFEEAYKMTPSHMCTLLLMCFVIAFSLPFYLAGQWWSVPVVIIFTWMVTASLMHDGSHFAISTDWRVNQLFTHAAPWLASSSTWFIQHVIGHHAHTNVPERDPDLYHAPHNWRLVSHIPWIPFYTSQTWRWPMMWTLATVSTAILNEIEGFRMYNGVVNTQRRTTPFYWFFYVVRLVLLVMIFATPVYFRGWQGLTFSVITWLGLSLSFMTFSQVSHLDENCGKARDSNFWIHQIMTSIDYSNLSHFWSLLSVGLNAQTIHHLFPTIHSCHYSAVCPIIKKVCQRHHLAYQEKPSLFHALSDYFDNLRAMSFPDDSHQKPSPPFSEAQKAAFHTH